MYYIKCYVGKLSDSKRAITLECSIRYRSFIDNEVFSLKLVEGLFASKNF